MTPKIVTRLANIAAKLAGSDKYDPTIEPVTAFEYYLDKGVDKILTIKGVPAAEAGDKGKVLSVSSSGAPVWEDKGPLVVTFSGTTEHGDAVCDYTYEELQVAITAGKILSLRYQHPNYYVPLTTITMPNVIIGEYSYVGTPVDPEDSDYLSIRCVITRDAIDIIVNEF